MLAIRLLGPLELLLNGTPVPHFRARKSHWLLALLVLRHGRELERAWLAGMLWPNSSESDALNSLRVSLSDLRRALGSEAGRLSSPSFQTLCLDLQGAEVDVVAFDAAIARSEESSLKEAIALYRGPLLESCTQEWAFQERQAREQAYLQALETLAAAALARSEPAAAEGYLRRAAATDPLRETAQRALMQVLAAGGNYAAALRCYRQLRLVLHRELSAEPDPQTQALFQQIRDEARFKAGARGRGPGVRGQEARISEAPASPACADPALLAPAPWSAATAPSPLAPDPCFRAPDPSGAMPLDSAFYVVRPVDREFRAAIARQESIVLIKGARQMGKTSLLARGLQQAREAGARVVLTDLEKLNAAHLESAEALLLTLAQWLAVQLDLDVLPDEVWNPRYSPNLNFELYLRRQMLPRIPTPIVWGIDTVDRLFPYAAGSEIFGLFRSWHNERSPDPAAPWSRLTLAMTYATEAHLFIRDMNRSPFNVGTRLMLDDLTLPQVADLNRRYGSPLQNDAEVTCFFALVNGCPYLVQRGLYEMARHGVDLDSLEARAADETGIFGDHLRSLLALLAPEPDLCNAVRELLRGRPTREQVPCSAASFYRLRSAGVVAGETASEARPRCQLYALYLERHLVECVFRIPYPANAEAFAARALAEYELRNTDYALRTRGEP